mgnify:CR=1 FL=1
MARIAGVEIPSDKQIWIALTYIYGIGKTSSLKILRATNVNPYKKVNELTSEEISRIQEEISRNYKVEGELRREIQQNIQRLISIGCYRGIRHRLGLPVRGQRTRTNARTRKGPRKTVATGRRSRGARGH